MGYNNGFRKENIVKGKYRGCYGSRWNFYNFNGWKGWVKKRIYIVKC